MKRIAATAVFAAILGSSPAQEPVDHLHFAGEEGPGKGKHVVLLSGDEEYRSEEAMPMLAQLLARQGFECTVLFSLNKKGEVDPGAQKSLAHSEGLDSADAVVMSLRFRAWEDEAMEKFDKLVRRGTPIVALRTSTHAFKFSPESRWAKYSFSATKDSGWAGGFGRQILGETWVSHHGKHKVQGCRSVVEDGRADNEILNGVGEIFAESDVYGADPPEDVTVLLRGEVTESLEPDSKAVGGKQNDPMMPIVWTRELDAMDGSGKRQRVVTTTMGAASDLDDENLRRLLVNGVFWSLGLEVPEKADVSIDGDFDPTFYGFNEFKKGAKPADFIIRPSAKGAAAPRQLAPGKTKASS